VLECPEEMVDRIMDVLETSMKKAFKTFVPNVPSGLTIEKSYIWPK